MAGNLVQEGQVRALPIRFITEETCRHWRYQCGEYDGKPVQIANYCNDAGEVVAQKLRFPGKDFTFLGEPKQAGLYGQWLWRDGGKMLVVTEGEIDALSVSQLQQNKWPVVSVQNGAAGAAKSIAKQIEWVQKFDKVVFLLDDDEPGHAAAKECAELLTPGKAFIGRIAGYKDANDALKKGDGTKVIDAIWGAKAYRPDGVVEASDLFDSMMTEAVNGVAWPWPMLTKATYGIRLTELYAFGAGVGIGKSDAFKEVMLQLVSEGHNVGCLAFEEAPKHTLKVLSGKWLSRRLHVPGETLSEADLARAKEYLGHRIFLFDHFGAMDYPTVKERIRYMVTALNCKYIFLDHLTALAAQLDDERRGLDKILADLSSMAQQLNFALFFVSHLTTPEGKSHEEGGRVLEKHFTGSRAIARWAHFMFGLERNKQDQGSPTTFRVLKDRFTGDSAGLTFGLQYNRETGRLIECPLPTAGEKSGFKDESGSTAPAEF